MNIKLFNKLQAAVISEGVAIDCTELSTSVISETLPETTRETEKIKYKMYKTQLSSIQLNNIITEL